MPKGEEKMKKLALLFLILGMFFLTDCKPVPQEVYRGVLKTVEYYPAGGFFGRSASWLITFEDGTIYSRDCAPEGGFTVGVAYAIYYVPGNFRRTMKKVD